MPYSVDSNWAWLLYIVEHIYGTKFGTRISAFKPIFGMGILVFRLFMLKIGNDSVQVQMDLVLAS